jgi:hypothetical protein
VVDGAAVGCGGGGAELAPNRTLSTVSCASVAPNGRSMTRTAALCASSGACTGPVDSSPVVPALPVSKAESPVESCEPLPSLDAYQATRTQAASMPGPSTSHALAAYHAPGVTRTIWYRYFVEVDCEVSRALPPTTSTSAPTSAHPYSPSSKPPFVSELNGPGSDGGAVGAAVELAVAVGFGGGGVAVAPAVGAAVAVGCATVVGTGDGVGGGSGPRSRLTSSTKRVAPAADASALTPMRA